MSWKFNTGDYVNLSTCRALACPPAGWTIAGWARLDTVSSHNFILASGDVYSGIDAFRIASFSTGPNCYCRFEVSAGDLWVYSGHTPLVNVWQFWAARFTPTLMTFRVGSAIGTDAPGSPPVATTLPAQRWVFGKGEDVATAAIQLNGYLAHWAKWNRPLSNAEIVGLARGLPPSAVPTPAWYFPMDSLLDAQGQVTAVPSGISFAALEPPVIRTLDDAGALPRKLAATMPTVFFPRWGRPRRRTDSRPARSFPSLTPRPPDSGPLHIPSTPRAVFPARPRLLDRGKQCYTMDVRGRHRVFDAAEYRFYRGSSAPPSEGDTPFATSSALPATPGETFADGTWYLSVSYSNGVLDSGFLPIGTNGETYVKLVVAGGAANPNPPPAPTVARLEPTTDGARLFVTGFPGNEALEWALAYTTDGSMPPADTPDVTAAAAEGVAIMTRLWDSLTDGTTLKVRVQFRRNDGTVEAPVWVYSESILLATTVDTSGPTAALVAECWTGGFQ